jgi:hypothetical protein
VKNERRDPSIRVERLTESYRFDDELAALLTQFQYREDGIRLTAAEKRPLPSTAYDASTAGLDAVLASNSSLVFICYDERGHRMVNSVETILIHAIIDAVESAATTARPDGGTTAPLGEGPEQPSPDEKHHAEEQPAAADRSQSSNPSVGVVTPHNAQRGALDTRLPDDIMANTVEKYQGGERDIITVSGTVSDPEFARREERFILNPRRLLVAISRSRLLTVVVCSTALFEVAPDDSERLDDGPVWARLFTQAVGRDADPAWAGSLGEFVGEEATEHAAVPVRVYPSTIDVADGDQ